jgi:CRISPR-associated protein Csm3
MRAFAQTHAPLISHEAAGKRYHISATLVLDQPLHVGSGHGSNVTDSAVIKDHANRPVIPGSSLRGALRSRCERLADALLPEDNKICFLYAEGTDSSVDCVGVKPELLRLDNGDLLPDRELWSGLQANLCPSCRLFGASSYWASKVRIPDLPMETPQEAVEAAQVRHGVGIHRDTQTAAPAVKYDQEVVTTNARFKLEMIVENPDDDDLSLLALGLADLAHGRMALGGNTSRGLGGCHLEDGRVQWIDLRRPGDLIPYLTRGDFPAANEQELESWLVVMLERWVEEE